jgi:hypothetical protein
MKSCKFWIICALGLWLAAGHAEPVRKSSATKVANLDAAARATAALYASMPVPAMSTAPAVQNTPAPPAADALTATQAASEVWAGVYQCELAEKVHLRPDPLAEHVDLQWKGQRWKMRRTDSRSGALRLEDATARMVWIQLANKSMLLDQRLGRRLLDECQHDEQVQTAARMKTNPAPTLFDTTGMGR